MKDDPEYLEEFSLDILKVCGPDLEKQNDDFVGFLHRLKAGEHT